MPKLVRDYFIYTGMVLFCVIRRIVERPARGENLSMAKTLARLIRNMPPYEAGLRERRDLDMRVEDFGCWGNNRRNGGAKCRII